MKTLRYFFVAALAMVGMNAVAGNATATLTFPAAGGESISSYTKEWTASVDGFDWVLNGFNSNKNAWAYVKCGRKDNAQTASITSPAVNAVITDFVVSIDKTANVESANVTIEGSDQIIDATAQFLAGDMDVKLTNHVAGKKITLTINSAAASANGPTQISKVALYEAGQYEEVHIANTPETAYTVAKAFELIDAGQALGETVYVKGVISQIDGYNSTYKSITYWISDDGTTTTQLECYSGKGVDGADFASADDIATGAIVIVKGTLAKYQPSQGDPIYEFNSGNQMYSYQPGGTGLERVWDFTVLPTQVCDGTGNMKCNIDGGKIDPDPNKWSQFENVAGVAEGSELTVKAGEVFEPTKGLIFSAMDSKQTVIYRNYPEMSGDKPYGGIHFTFNKPGEVMIPAKAGQVIELFMASSKAGSTKKITSQDVVETFDDGEGAQVGGLKLTFETAHDYKTYTLTAKLDNPYLAFESTLCLKKITVKDGGGAGIAAVKAANKFAGTQMYNLAGQKVGKDYKGIVIVNGKKVVLK